MKKFCIALLVVTLMLSISGCESTKTTKEIEAADESLTISLLGLESEALEVKVGDIKQLNSVTKEVTSVNSSGTTNTFKVTGALLSDLLTSINKDMKDFVAIRLIAGDGYSMEVPEEVIKNRDILLAYMMDDKPLDKQTSPLRVIIPEERAMYWVRNLETIEFITKKEVADIREIKFIEAMLLTMNQEPYVYYDSIDLAVKAADFLPELSYETIAIKAKDGLFKHENPEIFKSAYIKTTGNEAPTFLSPDMPKGMYVKDILWFNAADIVYYSVESGLSITDRKTVDGQEGIPVLNIFKEVNIKDGDIYSFIAEDGYQVDIEAADLSKGIVFIREDGLVSVRFEGLPKNTSVKGLLTIKLAE